MFDVVVESPDHTLADRKVYVYQNSWGLSTRTIGVMVMVHGDDQGLVLPPRVALQQVVIVPVGMSKKVGANDAIYDRCMALERELIGAGIRAKADCREGYTPGWKFNEWELKVSLSSDPRPTRVQKLMIYRVSHSDWKLVPRISQPTLHFPFVDTIITKLPCHYLISRSPFENTSMIFKLQCLNELPRLSMNV